MPLARRKLPEEEEIVEDSEPEREAARKRVHENQSRESSKATTNVIEISDDSLDERPLPVLQSRVQSRAINVIEISDSSFEVSKQPAAATTNSSTRPTVNTEDDFDSDADNSLPSLRHLVKFAHVSATTNRPRPAKTKDIPSLAVRSMGTLAGNAAGPSRSTRLTAGQNLVQRLTETFPGDSLSRLLGCVSCDSVWTTRKSIPQKITHMKTCAKKHGIQDDTLVTMIRKALEKAPAIQPNVKGKATAVEDPKTFFDEVVDDAAPKKRVKRQEVISTVKGVGETRDAIMLKARTIVAKGESRVRAIREHRSSDGDLSSTFHASSTPKFGRSNLALKLGMVQSMLHSDPDSPSLSPSSSDSRASSIAPHSPISLSPTRPIPISPRKGDIDDVHVLADTHNLAVTPIEKTTFVRRFIPPRTQNDNSQSVRKSRSASPRLIYISSNSSVTSPEPAPGAARRKKEVKISDSDSDLDQIPPSSPPLTPSPRKRISSTFSKPLTSKLLKHRHDDSEPSLSQNYDDDFEEQYIDESYLHHDLDYDSIPFSPPVTTTTVTRKTPSPSSSPIRRSRKSRSKSRSPTRSPATSRRKRAKVPANTDKDIVFDEAWAEDLKRKIIEDTALHLRILRYEPIPFNVFLSMAETSSGGKPSSAKLKSHLREFLDKQAINFYGADPVGRRRR